LRGDARNDLPLLCGLVACLGGDWIGREADLPKLDMIRAFRCEADTQQFQPSDSGHILRGCLIRAPYCADKHADKYREERSLWEFASDGNRLRCMRGNVMQTTKGNFAKAAGVIPALQMIYRRPR
jgi:hypothetical protein